MIRSGLTVALWIALSTPQCRAQGRDVPASESGAATQATPHPWCTSNGSVSPMVLTSGGLGPIRPGVSKAELRRVCPGLRDTTWEGAEGIPQTATILRLGGKDIGLVEWYGRDSVLNRVLIDVRFVRTTESIGVGTTVRELRDRLGQLQAGYDDAGVYVWSAQNARFSYLLKVRVTRLVKVPDEIGQHVDLIPGDVQVRTLIFVGR
jgi:hypothetical protein